MTKIIATTTFLTTFINDFLRSFIYYIQSALLFAAHLTFHLIIKVKRLFSKFIVPATYDFLYSVRFVAMVIAQGTCEMLALTCIFLSSILIKGGRFFNNISMKLLEKYGW